MNRTIKTFLFIAIPIIIAVFSVPSSAQTKQASLVTLENSQDLLVMFRYETEVVDIDFISPAGTKYTKNSKDLEYESGELWRTYRIKQAEAGEWKVEYDLGSNSQIGLNIVDDDLIAASGLEDSKGLENRIQLYGGILLIFILGLGFLTYWFVFSRKAK